MFILLMIPSPPPLLYTASQATVAPIQVVEAKVIEESIPDKIRRYGGDSSIVEVALAIAEVESEFNPNAKNPTSSASGVFQITNATWEDNCEGSNHFDPDNNIICGIKMLENDEFWRWESSEDLWLEKIPEEMRDEIRKKCWCFYYAKSQGVDVDPSTPHIGGGILFQYKTTFHIAVITEIREDGFMVKESNYSKCKIKSRLVAFNDPAIFKFVK